MISTAPTSSETFASAWMACSCHRTAGAIAKFAKARPLLVSCMPLISQALLLRLLKRFDPFALSNPRFQRAKLLFQVAINPA